jgi:hypothetical protein
LGDFAGADFAGILAGGLPGSGSGDRLDAGLHFWQRCFGRGGWARGSLIGLTHGDGEIFLSEKTAFVFRLPDLPPPIRTDPRKSLPICTEIDI